MADQDAVNPANTKYVETRFLGRFERDDIASIKLVALGGLFGGLLQPVVARLNPAQVNPPLSNFLFGPILGIAAAGITVFVLANSNTDNKMRLLFFSLLCGLAFPAVLTSAVESVDPRSQKVSDRAEQIATKAAAGNTSAAAAELSKTMIENPTAVNIDRNAEAQIETTADAVVTGLAVKAKAGEGASADKAIAQLKQLGTAALSSGYDGTALRVAKELREIEASDAAGTVQKEEAGDAANDVIGLPLMSQPTP